MPTIDFYLPLDPSGVALANRITLESHTLVNTQYRIILPKYGAYFSNSLTIDSIHPTTLAKTRLTRGVDYHCTELLPKVTFQLGKEVLAAILIINQSLPANIEINYQALGGSDNINKELLYDALTVLETTNADIDWSEVIKPTEFTPAHHLQDSADIYGLEYVVAALERVKDAVAIGDAAFHAELLDLFENAKESFYYIVDNQVNDQVDLISNDCFSAKDALVLTHKSLLTNQEKTNTNEMNLAITNSKLDYFELHNLNAFHALSLILLSNKQYEFNQTILDIPAKIKDLVFRLDSDIDTQFSTVDNVLTFTDGTETHRTYTSSTISRNTGIQYPLLKSLKFDATSQFDLVNSIPLELKAPLTIFCLTGDIDLPVYLNLFNDTNYKIKIDIKNSIAIALVNNQEIPIASVKSTIYNSHKKHLVVMTLNTDYKESISHTNALASTYKFKNGFEETPSFTGILDCDKLGKAEVAQTGELYSLFIYNRALSYCEIEAVLEFYKKKYNLTINLLGNGQFDDNLTEFETEYTESFDAQLPNQIASVSKYFIKECSTISTYYDYPGYMAMLDVLATETNVLLVNSDNSTINKAFWKQSVKLDRYVRYEFMFTVLYDPLNPPILKLRINDVDQLISFNLPNTTNIQTDLKFTFINLTDTTSFSLINTKTTASRFIIDRVMLVKNLYATN